MAELSDFQLRPGARAPDFELPGVDGRTYRLQDFSGRRRLVVTFWCNHCPYVQAWEGRMIELGREFQPLGVGFILINSNDAKAYPTDSFEYMVQRARDRSYPFPYVRDESQETARDYGALVTPHSFLFDRDRRLLFQGRIDDNHEQPHRGKVQYLREAIRATLDDLPLPRADVPVRGCSIKWR